MDQGTGILDIIILDEMGQTSISQIWSLIAVHKTASLLPPRRSGVAPVVGAASLSSGEVCKLFSEISYHGRLITVPNASMRGRWKKVGQSPQLPSTC
jgi:hypothetical protein